MWKRNYNYVNQNKTISMQMKLDFVNLFKMYIADLNIMRYFKDNYKLLAQL